MRCLGMFDAVCRSREQAGKQHTTCARNVRSMMREHMPRCIHGSCETNADGMHNAQAAIHPSALPATEKQHARHGRDDAACPHNHTSRVYYTPGVGACGWTNTEADHIAAVSHQLFDSYGCVPARLASAHKAESLSVEGTQTRTTHRYVAKLLLLTVGRASHSW